MFKAILLAWFFFYPWYGGSIVGPFPDKETCDKIRNQIGKSVTECWSDGRGR